MDEEGLMFSKAAVTVLDEAEGVVCLGRQGQVLNQTSCWWMHRTQHIIPNALTAEPHPNAVVMQRCQVFPVEFVVRGFITGQPTASQTHAAPKDPQLLQSLLGHADNLNLMAASAS